MQTDVKPISTSITLTERRLPEAFKLPDSHGQEYLPEAYCLPEGEERGVTVKHLPRCVFIEVTNKCNLLCAHCPRTFYTYEEPMTLSFETFREIVAQFPTMERAVLHGIGEPLLNRELPRVIRYLKERDVAVLFNSNGTLLTPAWQEALALSGLDEFHCSLDGADPETYHRVRGKRLFPRVVENLRAFVETKNRLGVDTPNLSIWFVGMRENIYELPELIRLAAQVGVPEVYLQRIVYYADPEDRQGVAQEEQRLFGNWDKYETSIIAKCEELSTELGIVLRASGATGPRRSLASARPPDERPWTACMRPWTTAYVTANGNCLPCCISPFATTDYESLILGNLFDHDFAQIWNNQRYQQWRTALLSDNPHKACAGCGVYWSL